MMKKYILTEEQLNKVLNSKVTKGIGLKIQDNDGEYYKSIIKTFDTDREFKDWENNLKEGTTIIGIIDIDDPQPETISEGVNVKKKDKGIQMLERLMIKKYPFITKMEIGHKGDGYINLNIYFNLNKFYEITGTKPPVDYVRYQQIYKKYKLRNDSGFEHEILFYILNKMEGRKRINHKNFKEGNLVLSEEDANTLDSKLNDLTEFLPKIIDSGKRYYLKALSDIMDLEIDKSRLNEKLISFGKDIPFSKQKEFSIRFLAEKVYNQNLKSKKIYLYKAGNDDILLQVK